MAEETTLQRVNKVEIIGTLKDVNLEERVDKNAQDYISGSITVESTINGEKNEYEIDLYSKKLTKAGVESKIFTSFAELKQQIGHKVRVTGEFRENRYFNKTTNLLASSQRISGRFVNAEKAETPDKGTFEFSGFVTKPLEAKTRKDSKEVYTYELSVGQSNWDGSQLSIFKFNVDPENVNIVKAVNSLFKLNSTIQFGGDLRFVVTQNEVKTESAFGEARVKVFTNTQKNYFITWGNEPISDLTNGMYDANTILALDSAYNKRDTELLSENQTNSIGNAATTISSVQRSLI